MTVTDIDRPASPRQVSYVSTLLNDRVVPADAAARLSGLIERGALTGVKASDSIEWLLRQPRKTPGSFGPRSTGNALPDVPAGRYAIEVAGGEETDGEPVLRFFKVDRPEAPSRWAGYTFVKQLAGPEEWPVRGARANTILAEIAKDPAGASARYGHEIGACGICGRRLTDAESRARGIGPICADKVGW